MISRIIVCIFILANAAVACSYIFPSFLLWVHGFYYWLNVCAAMPEGFAGVLFFFGLPQAMIPFFVIGWSGLASCAGARFLIKHGPSRIDAFLLLFCLINALSTIIFLLIPACLAYSSMKIFYYGIAVAVIACYAVCFYRSKIAHICAGIKK